MKVKLNGRYVKYRSDAALLFEGGVSFQLSKGTAVELLTDLPLLYKRDSRGRLQIIKFSLLVGEGHPSIRRVITTEGLRDREWVSPVKPVATKPLSDVVQERLISAWNKKKNRDGWSTEKDAPVLKEPMLLHLWEDHKSRIVYPAVIMPKLNGVRATFKPGVGLISRKRNPFDKLGYLNAQLERLGMSIDSELWHPDMSFEEIVSCVKGGQGTDLQVHIIDRPHGGTFVRRMANLMQVYKKTEGIPNIYVTQMAFAHNEEELLAMRDIIWKMKGVDGAVVRNVNGVYQWNSRSKEVLKMKPIIHHEFCMIGMEYERDSDGTPLAIFRFEHEGMEFHYVPAASKKERAEMWQDYRFNPPKYVGTVWTLSFREWTAKGLPKHIKGFNRRDYE